MKSGYDNVKFVCRLRIVLALLAFSTLLLQSRRLYHIPLASDEEEQIITAPLRFPEPPSTKSTIQKPHYPANPSPRQEDPEDSYLTDSLCGGCRWTPSKRSTCGKRIAQRIQWMKQKNSSNSTVTLVEAAKGILGEGYKECQKCLACDAKHKVYWRPDRVGPRILQATTHYLPSIPASHRIPAVELARDNPDLADYLRDHPSTPDRPYLFEYNPSIVAFPHPSNPLKVNGETPAYLASYRVSSQQACFPTNTTLQLIGGDWQQRPKEVSYLGLALLRHDLSIIADVLVDPPRNLGRPSDFRLFVLKDQLYATTLRKATPLWIGTTQQPPFSDPKLTQPYHPANLYDNDTVPSLLLVNGGKNHLRTTVDYNPFIGSAKNLNYFEDAQGILQMEFQPPGNSQSQYQPHVVQPVHLDVHDCQTKKSALSRFDYYNHSVHAADLPPHQSFYTMDELVLARHYDSYESPYTPDRGGACCLEIQHPEHKGKRLLVGISHVKPPFAKNAKARQERTHTAPNQYLSRLYAFEPTTPFAIVAMSGYFCWKTPSSSKGQPTVQGWETNPLSSRPLHDFFSVSNMTLDCPAIHFVSGMTLKVDDPTKVILAYGVQDCTTWFVEVNKAELVDLLFRGPSTQREDHPKEKGSKKHA